MDTCRATGLPETASNLLLHPHRFTSSKVLRLDTRFYLSMEESSGSTEEERETRAPNSKLNELLCDVAKEIDDFDLPGPVNIKSNTCNEDHLCKPDKIADNYFNRPEYLYNTNKLTMCSTEHMCMTEYIENYTITQKKKITHPHQSKDKRNKVIEPRKCDKQDCVLDLKFRVSPPDPNNPKWCAGALALCVPHRSLNDLLICSGEKKSLTDAYKFYYSKLLSTLEGSSFPLFPLLHKFEENETDLYNATTAQNLCSHNREFQSSTCDDIDHKIIDTSPGELPESDSDNEEYNIPDLDPESFPYFSTNAKTNLREDGTKAWDGSPQNKFIHAKNPWKPLSNEIAGLSTLTIDNSQISEKHMEFMSHIIAGENPSIIEENPEVMQHLAHADGNRQEAANMFLSSVRAQCKSKHQRVALDLVSNVLEAYYYGHYKTGLTKEALKTIPIITMIGVPGAGKSWVVNKLRTWVDIRCHNNDSPFESEEFSIIKELGQKMDSVTKKVFEIIQNFPPGKYEKSAAMAFSGSAAGIVNGFTVHHALGFPVNINKQVTRGEIPLPPLSSSSQARLLECWTSVKLLIIDEVYMLQVEWLSLIDERLRQILNSNIPFGGIPVLLVGDPRQIVPVKGKALYMITKYFNLDSDKLILTENGVNNLCCREEKGYRLYASSKFKAPLTTSIRLSDTEFAKLSMKIATYQVTEKDLKEINKLCVPKKILYSSPWIDSPWLLPTWREVNEHINFLANRAKSSKGIFRAWSTVTVKSHTTQESAVAALTSFYSSSTVVSAQFKCPLPYIDFFIGQIICLKQNWNPKWKLFNNAKAFVVGIKCDSKSRQNNPLMTMDEAICTSLSTPENLKYSLLVKTFLPFNGPSAIQEVPGIIVVPWTQTLRKICGCKLLVEGPRIFPANAFSRHQSQGSTFDRSVANINENSKAYGMANVVTSRTPRPENFALAQPVSLHTLQPRLDMSNMVEKEYVRLSKPS